MNTKYHSKKRPNLHNDGHLMLAISVVFLNHVIVPDSLKMCHMYIRTCNRKESVNKQIQNSNVYASITFRSIFSKNIIKRKSTSFMTFSLLRDLDNNYNNIDNNYNNIHNNSNNNKHNMSGIEVHLTALKYGIRG